MTETNYGSVSRRLQVRHLATRALKSDFSAEDVRLCGETEFGRARAYLAGGGNFERIFATALLMVFVVFSGVGLGSTTPLAVPRQMSFLEVR